MNRTRIFFLLSMMLCLIMGCSGIATTPTALPTETATPPSQPTIAPAPTTTDSPAATPTLTPEPSLRTNGPYFSYFRQVDGAYQLVLMDADGGGRKVIDLPQGITDSLPNKNFGLDMKFVSPDGKWLAFYTGSPGNYGFGQDLGNGPFDLTLNLLDLETGEKQDIALLLSKDYPNNFSEAEKQINKPEITAVTLQSAFLAGITNAIAWSPDGKHLAFAGQMDGLSSDLYLYDMTTKKIQRLSSGDEELQWINWSPDGKWIIHGSIYWVGEGMIYDIYAASVDDVVVKYLVKASAVGSWLDPNTLIVYDNQNVFGDFEFRLIDIKTGSVRKIWDGPVLSVALNPIEKKFVLFAYMFGQSPYLSAEPDPNFVPGLYLIDLKTFKRTYIKALSDNSSGYSISSFGVGENVFAFLGVGADQDSYLFSKTDEVSPLGIKGIEVIESSPDRSHWIAVTDTGINIYSASNVLINSIDLPFHDLLTIQRTEFLWQPDSSGLILVSGENLYSVNISTDAVNLMETNLINNNYGSTYKWLTGQ
ncbi:MAG: hypothetical protein ABI986_08080 [Chloroflexota bacterium]